MIFKSGSSIEAHRLTIGEKAKNLLFLERNGFAVPKFVVIPHEILLELVLFQIPHLKQLRNQELLEKLNQLEILPMKFVQEITNQFPGVSAFAVRSSSEEEDKKNLSFAGQFSTFLNVDARDLGKNIIDVWSSSFKISVSIYKNNNGLKGKSRMGVIVQEMVNADVSGVAFGIHPVTNNSKVKLINTVRGLGNELVSGNLKGQSYTIQSDGIVFEGLSDKSVLKEEPNLTNHNVYKIEGILNHLNELFNLPQDIEFAFKGEDLFLLQSRPITTFEQIETIKNSYTVWDNSNIIESYPGVTTPLTFSFIRQSYQKAYQLFCGYMGVEKKVIEKNEKVFANTLGLINGRVYYNLKSWYQMLALAPGFSINARFMENMMGVKERFDIPETYKLSKGKASYQILLMIFKMTGRLCTLSQKRKEFYKLVNKIIGDYKKINFKNKSANELWILFCEFEKTLLNEWKAPLINDFFAMISYGVLKNLCAGYMVNESPNIHNDLLCGSSDIISTQPIHRTILISTLISNDLELKNLFLSESESLLWKRISEDSTLKVRNLKKEIENYIEDFGERCIGELKLETISYRQDPTLFIKVLKAYVESNISENNTNNKVENEIRKNAEQKIAHSLKNKWISQFILKIWLNLTRKLVSGRENLRFERTRAFGMVREIFISIGYQFRNQNIIELEGDIFYLTKEEIESFIEGTSVTQNIKELIKIRKMEFLEFKSQKVPAERFSTFGIVYHANDFYNRSKMVENTDALKGIGCCPGIVRGKVRVVLESSDFHSLNGDILVTSSTDPGWVTLFPSALGIITERGSVLSHSAILSREMGKPCIVGVNDLLKKIKSGDEIIMDGSTGIITLI